MIAFLLGKLHGNGIRERTSAFGVATGTGRWLHCGFWFENRIWKWVTISMTDIGWIFDTGWASMVDRDSSVEKSTGWVSSLRWISFSANFISKFLCKTLLIGLIAGGHGRQIKWKARRSSTPSWGVNSEILQTRCIINMKRRKDWWITFGETWLAIANTFAFQDFERWRCARQCRLGHS